MSENWKSAQGRERVIKRLETVEKKLKEYSDYMVKVRRIQQDIEAKLMEMKEWERYLAKGGLLEQIIERVDKLEESYIHSMDRIIRSFQNCLRRIRKLEGIKFD